MTSDTHYECDYCHFKTSLKQWTETIKDGAFVPLPFSRLSVKYGHSDGSWSWTDKKDMCFTCFSQINDKLKSILDDFKPKEEK